MLVLTRKNGESLRIGSEVRVTILSAGGGSVRIGIEAPRSLAIHREEVYERIEEANREAAGVSLELVQGVSQSIGAEVPERDEGGKP